MSEIDRELLNRYLSGDVSPEESDRVEAWLAEDPDRWTRVSEARDAIAGAALSDSAVRRAQDEVWARLETEVGGAGGLRAKKPTRRPRPAPREFGITARRRIVGGQLAAVLFLAAVGGAALAVWHRTHQAAPAPMRVATTAPGQRATFRLPDGTRVMLGVASTLRYPADFATGHREVTLEGEAYFDVLHDVRRPFSVRAGNLVAKDLGTQFTVRDYSEDSGARVVVRQGSVAIRAVAGSTSERIVLPGQLGRLAKDQAPTVEQADTAAWFAWTQGRLVLDQVPLREALPQLGRWFDLDFRLADSASGDVPLSATLKAQPTADVLNNLAASLGMRQRRVGRTVMLYSAEPHQ